MDAVMPDPAALGPVPQPVSAGANVALPEPTAATAGSRRRSSVTSVVAGFTGLNFFVLVLGVITGPLQARALGPTGRGELAAILVVIQQLSLVATFGVVAYATREAARGASPGDLVGSIGALLVVVGVLLIPAGIPLSGLLAHGRPVVRTYIMVAFVLLPLTLPGILLQSLLGGLERWRLMAASRVIPMVLPAAGIVILYLSHAMTVAAVAIVSIAGGVLAITPALFALREWWPLRFRAVHIRKGVPFGLKSWLGYLAAMTNGRLDQLLMAGLASSRQLGFYAVAVTVASLPNVLIGAVGPPLLTKIAAGDKTLIPRALRTCLAGVGVAGCLLSLASLVVIPSLFGAAFRPAVPMAIILLAAGIPLAGVSILGSAFVADGAPSLPAIGELITLGITVPGLVVVLPIWGGVGAAVVSGVAYGANFVLQLIAARRRFGGAFREYMTPTRQDLRSVKVRLTAASRRLVRRP
jgi:O-antigen/teichoic acid export membrane protein